MNSVLSQRPRSTLSQVRAQRGQARVCVPDQLFTVYGMEVFDEQELPVFRQAHEFIGVGKIALRLGLRLRCGT